MGFITFSVLIFLDVKKVNKNPFSIMYANLAKRVVHRTHIPSVFKKKTNKFP